MKKLVLIICLGILLAATCGAEEMLTFTDFQPAGWQVGYPYYATINGGPVINVMCDDWAHGGLPGDQWLANITVLGSGDLTYLRFNQATQNGTPLTPQEALTLYREAGWLLLQTRTAPTSEWPAINYAVWHIFDTDAPLDGTPWLGPPLAPVDGQSWLTAAQQQAAVGFPGANFQQVDILTPWLCADQNGQLTRECQHDTNLNGPQELLMLTPEPGTLAFAGASLLALIGKRNLWRAR